jgi:hypothetical protein
MQKETILKPEEKLLPPSFFPKNQQFHLSIRKAKGEAVVE